MGHDHRFWDKIADKYFSQPIADEAAYQEKLRLTREHLTPSSDVLEIGCGTGGTAIAHAPFVHSIHALDISERMLQIARAQAADRRVTNVTFEQADIADYAPPAGAYDAVLALSLLHLVEDRGAVLDKIKAALKPGGVFISSTACLGDRMGFFRWIAPIGKALGRMPLVNVFTVSALEESLAAAGFEILRTWRVEKGHTAFVIARG